MTWTLSNGDVPDIEVVLSDRLGEPTRGSGSISYLCPFHDDKNPSLVIQPEFNQFRCFACGAKGDAIDFLRRYHKEVKQEEISFGEATRMLEELFTDDEVRPPRQAPVRQGRKQPSSDAMEKIVQSAAGALWELPGAQALAELRVRGLTDQAIFTAQLGFLEEKRYLPGPGGCMLVPAGIVISWRDQQGKAVMLKIRRPEGSEPKYLSVGSLPRGALYVASPFRRGGPLIITEGELDALLLGQELAQQATVVTLGSADTNPDEDVLLRFLGCGDVFVAHDADEAGDRAAAKWTTAFPRCQRAIPPVGKDWTEAHQQGVDLQAFWLPLLNGPISAPTPIPTLPPLPIPAPIPEPVPIPMSVPLPMLTEETKPWWYKQMDRWSKLWKNKWWYLACRLMKEEKLSEVDAEYRAFARMRRELDQEVRVWVERAHNRSQKKYKARHPNHVIEPFAPSWLSDNPVYRDFVHIRIIVGPGELGAESALEAVRCAFDADPDREPGTVALEGEEIVHTDTGGRRSWLFLPLQEFTMWADAYKTDLRLPIFFDATLIPIGPPRGPILTEEEIVDKWDLIPWEHPAKPD
jgi:hypothetical protein